MEKAFTKTLHKYATVKEPKSVKEVYKHSIPKKSPLAAVVNKDTKSLVKILSKDNSDIDNKDFLGHTALHLACMNNDLDSACILINHGADVNMTDAFNRAPIHSVCSSGFKECLRILLESPKILLELSDSDGNTPLHKACELGEKAVECILILLERGVNLNTQNKCGETPLHCAVKTGYTPLVTTLVNRGADIEIQNLEYITPYDIAIANFPEIAEYLAHSVFNNNIENQQ